MPKRPRVLLIAEACNPAWVSVPLVGFNLYNALREQADLTLVTQIRNQPALQRRMDDDPDIVYINSEKLAAPFYHLGRILTLGRSLGWTTRQAVNFIPYLYFEKIVFRRFRDALARGEYDLIHRITPLSPTYASPLASWTDVPFVLGPLNGGLPWPQGTNRTRWAEMEWLSHFRGAYRFMPYARSMYRRAARVIAASKHTLNALPYGAKQRATYIPENAIDPAIFNAEGRPAPSTINPFRILFVGRLVPYKGADVVLEAFATSPALRERAEVVFVGDGPQAGTLRRDAERHGVTENVTFTGQLPQDAVVKQCQNASVFAFPSLREFGGGVVLEAMACGLPSVILDYGGPAELLPDDAGVKLAMTPRPQRVQDLRAALERLAAHPQRLDAMSQAGIDHVAGHFTWAQKARQIRGIYDEILTPAH